MTAAANALGVVCLITGTALIAYCAFTDLAGAPIEQPRRWSRPVLLLPTAIGAILLGGWLLRTP